MVPEEGASSAPFHHCDNFDVTLLIWCRRKGLLRHLFITLIWHLSVLDYLSSFFFMAPTVFSDCRHIVMKSGQFTCELDYRQEFFLHGPHSRQQMMHCMGAMDTITSLIIQLALKDSDIYSFLAYLSVSHGGKLAKSPSYDPTNGRRRNPAISAGFSALIQAFPFLRTP